MNSVTVDSEKEERKIDQPKKQEMKELKRIMLAPGGGGQHVVVVCPAF
jgi:hypothetical protein